MEQPILVHGHGARSAVRVQLYGNSSRNSTVNSCNCAHPANHVRNPIVWAQEMAFHLPVHCRLPHHKHFCASIDKMPACVNWYFVGPGYSRTLATVLSSGKNTATERMRACMKIKNNQFLL